MPSVVIPAHDEEATIGRLLRALAPLKGDVEVIVACNGCRDATADVARRVAPWATVLELSEASKPAALDAGDAAASSFPRAYVDADVEMDAASLRRLFAVVDDGIPAAAATPRYDLSRSSFAVRSHYAIWSRMATNNLGISGTNAMALSRAGRERFGSWPRLIGDDYFLDGVFGPQEKRRVPEAVVVRPVPRRARDCISRKARMHQGNLDVQEAGLRPWHQGGGLTGAWRVVRAEPKLAVHLPAHVAITVGSRAVSSYRRRKGTSQHWFRDESRASAGGVR